MWDSVGIVRNAEALSAAISQLRAWSPADRSPAEAGLQATEGGPGPLSLVPVRAEHELANMITVGRMMAEAALAREESRGAHYRTDFPQPREEWRRHVVFRKGR
jgi:L-aspartate oxidase